MHILIAAITAIGGLIWALYRLQNSGFDLNAFNPFYWARRREWEKKLGTKPIHRLENSMEAAALLVVAMARLEGEVTREHKQEVIQQFTEEFGISESAATEMFAVASHMLSDVFNIIEEVKNVLAPSVEQYETRHKETLLSMLEKVSTSEGKPNNEQQALLNAVKCELNKVPEEAKNW